MLSFRVEMDFCTNVTSSLRPNFRKADFVLINDIISCIDWDSEFKDLEVSAQLSILEKFIQDIVTTFIPLSTNNQNTRPAWMDNTTRCLVNKKRHAYNFLRKFPTPSNYAAFKTARNKVASCIRQAREGFERNSILKAKREPKELFSYINRNKKATTTTCLKTSQGAVYLEDKDIAAEFNAFFASTLKASALPPPSLSVLSGHVNFSVLDVENALLALKEDTSMGPDGLSPIFLKNCASSLAIPFYLIFRTSVYSCTFPKQWKDANITPVFKSGSKHDAKNYRPISLLSVASKILERFIQQDLANKCTDLNIIPASQHGFVPRRSCLSNLLCTYNLATQMVLSKYFM
jgi:hypothetical protein